jgi:hypothetical protein
VASLEVVKQAWAYVARPQNSEGCQPRSACQPVCWRRCEPVAGNGAAHCPIACMREVRNESAQHPLLIPHVSVVLRLPCARLDQTILGCFGRRSPMSQRHGVRNQNAPIQGGVFVNGFNRRGTRPCHPPQRAHGRHNKESLVEQSDSVHSQTISAVRPSPQSDPIRHPPVFFLGISCRNPSPKALARPKALPSSSQAMRPNQLYCQPRCVSVARGLGSS